MDVLAKRSKKAFDLAAGEPREVFLSLKHFAPQSAIMATSQRYPAIGGSKDLQDAIRTFLKVHGYPSEGRIVVTCGAKQALSAALYAIRGSYPSDFYIRHWGPYWPTLKSIVALSGFQGLEARDDWHTVDIVTSPNNPDGRQWSGLSSAGVAIWDAAYASPAYGWNGVAPVSAIQVYSLAKMFGLPGLRVGWLVTASDQLADAAESFVEVQTSGVAEISQNYAAFLLRAMTDVPTFKNFCRDVERRLNANRSLLENALHEHAEGLDEGTGMYLLFQPKKGQKQRFRKLFKELDVGFVDGKACGMTQEGIYRLNLAQEFEVVARLASELETRLRRK